MTNILMGSSSAYINLNWYTIFTQHLNFVKVVWLTLVIISKKFPSVGDSLEEIELYVVEVMKVELRKSNTTSELRVTRIKVFTLEDEVRKNLLEILYGNGSCEWCILREEIVSQEV